MNIRILVLNFNGRDLLEQYLPSVVRAASQSTYNCKLSVIDNASSDGSAGWLKTHFPEVSCFEPPENRVLCAYNEVASRTEEDVLVFLNNDIRVEPSFIDPLIRPFLDDKELFMTTMKCLSEENGRYEGNRTRSRIKWGLFWSSCHFPGYEKGVELSGPTLHAGFGAFHRQKFLELGGYDDLYLPGRLEDADICFRAWRHGWKSLYIPDSVVYHRGGVSFHRRFGEEGTLIINARNTFLFMWKNLEDKRLILAIWFFLPLRLSVFLLKGRMEWWIGFVQAIRKMPETLRRRREIHRQGLTVRKTDQEIFNLV